MDCTSGRKGVGGRRRLSYFQPDECHIYLQGRELKQTQDGRGECGLRLTRGSSGGGEGTQAGAEGRGTAAWARWGLEDSREGVDSR